MKYTIALLAAFACGSPTETASSPAATPALAAEGQRFDPAIEASEVPEGAWMCDMGTVHYAAGEKHEGKCPVCGMNLTQKTAE